MRTRSRATWQLDDYDDFDRTDDFDDGGSEHDHHFDRSDNDYDNNDNHPCEGNVGDNRCAAFLCTLRQRSP